MRAVKVRCGDCHYYMYWRDLASAGWDQIVTHEDLNSLENGLPENTRSADGSAAMFIPDRPIAHLRVVTCCAQP